MEEINFNWKNFKHNLKSKEVWPCLHLIKNLIAQLSPLSTTKPQNDLFLLALITPLFSLQYLVLLLVLVFLSLLSLQCCHVDLQQFISHFPTQTIIEIQGNKFESLLTCRCRDSFAGANAMSSINSP